MRLPRPLQLQSSAATGFTSPLARVERLELRTQVLVGSLGIAKLELQRLAYARLGGDGDDAGLLVVTEQVTDEEVAVHQFITVFVHRQAYKDGAARPLLDVLR